MHEGPVKVVVRHLFEQKSLFLVVAVRETFRYRLFSAEVDRPEAGMRIIDLRCPACGEELLLVVDSDGLLRTRRRTRLLTALIAAAVAVLSVLLGFGVEAAAGPIPIGSPLGVALMLGFLLGGLVAGVAGYSWWQYRGVRLSIGLGDTDGVHSLQDSWPLRRGDS
ncbi:hypothetical protein LO763_15750 [Glycomyces sp. A-F 0318]|uniref:hypothetical protein n=1 Tax=Glycomyces amatae TaxID=2881355 RepID=UPI001E58D432|nr:hypothetical protein [Glycomyces amatae]MCD0445070.1 hypothetical protein [Glycomyces amatae]